MEFFTHYIDTNICVGILPIQHYEYELLEKDKLYVENITHQDKKKEFLASRFLAKQMIEKQGFMYEGLDKNIFNAPSILNENIHISLSHSNHFTAFVISKNNPIGIDIEAKRNTLLKLQYKFLSEKERFFVNNDLELLTYFWCAKEALYKVYQQKKITFAEDMHIDWENKKAILFANTDKKRVFDIFNYMYQNIFLVCVY